MFIVECVKIGGADFFTQELIPPQDPESKWNYGRETLNTFKPREKILNSKDLTLNK